MFMKKGILIGLVAAYIAVLGGTYFYTDKKDHGLGELVNVPVTTSSNNFWDIRNQKDSDGDKLMSVNAPGWRNLISDVSLVNERGKSESLADVIEKNGYVTLPKKYVNPAYDFENKSN